MMVIFGFPTLKLVQNSIQKFAKMWCFFYYVRGGKVLEDFHKAIQFLKIKKWSVQVLFNILQLPHTVFLNSEKLTHPTVQPQQIMSQHKTSQLFNNIFFNRFWAGTEICFIVATNPTNCTSNPLLLFNSFTFQD